MRTLIATLAIIAVAGCGVDTATTAAAGAAIKKTELEEGKKTLEQSQQRIEQAAQQVQQRAVQGRESADK
jgi:cellobiose-specific phosphotransferase system component IIA